jgi:hypothetical protein
MPRTIKTPEQRATETLDVARRAEIRARKKATAAQTALTEARSELIAAEDRLAYVGNDPALPEQTRSDVATYIRQVRDDED